jgi:hypothetical protein
MQRLTKRLPSPAMVVACTALTIALGGTAWAATLPRNSVGTAQLKRNAVTSIKVRNNSLTGADIRESRLGTVPRAARATTANTATSATSATTAGNATSATTAATAASAPVSRLDYSATTTVSVPGTGAPTVGTVNCPTGLNATGGGAKVADPIGGNLIDTNPVGKTAWEARAFSSTATTMTVHVICAQAATTTP